ncbi:BglG family transcription antiterminator [Robertmurraya sp.]|uniref:BglG family transcription antiterminator n=1 Tax=Robertmurraya sp. TaxID=2837525 RepID=UPI0037044149
MIISRLTMILGELMGAKVPITSEYLASVIKVTSRTIRNDMKDLQAILEKNGADIKSVRGTGYELVVNNNQQFITFINEVFQDTAETSVGRPDSPEERIRYIITRLLLTNKFVKLDHLADEIFVSRSTILNDVKDIKKILSRYGLSLEKKPNYGLRIKGDEVKVRFCMSDYIFNKKRDELDIVNEQLNILTKEEILVIRNVILALIREHHITLSDVGLNNLIIHVAIACKRIREGNHVLLYSDELNEIIGQKEFSVAEKIVKNLSETLMVDFPENEVAYIAIHLLGTKMIEKSPGEQVGKVIDKKIAQLVSDILAKIDEKLSLGISEDKELLEQMCLHIKPAINRYRYGMNLRNPMIDEIKANYPVAFQAGLIAGKEMKKQLSIDIDENEIGYLALHIGVAMERKQIHHGPKRCLIVCASGVGSARLLYYKLQSTFGPKLDIVDTTEFYKLQQMDLHDIDFIISTVPIQQKMSIPVLHVNTFLGDQDLNKIRSAVSEQTTTLEYTREELVFLQQALLSKEEVFSYMFSNLKEMGLIDDVFIESVKERESLSSTSFGNFVAIPHPLNPLTDETFWSICTLQKPIEWDDKLVQFVCLLSVEKDSSGDLQRMYDMLGKVIDDRELVQQLIKAKSYHEFKDTFLKV